MSATERFITPSSSAMTRRCQTLSASLRACGLVVVAVTPTSTHSPAPISPDGLVADRAPGARSPAAPDPARGPSWPETGRPAGTLDRSVNGPESSLSRMSPADAPAAHRLPPYRGKPHVGGQGVYTRHLTKALVDLGHHVEVLGGQPYPDARRRGCRCVELPSLDIYNDHFPMRMPGLWELKRFADFVEVTSFSTGTFPEPLAFSVRACAAPARPRRATSTWSTTTSASATACSAIERDGPARARHDPPPDHRRPPPRDGARRDRAGSASRKGRWYAFTKMQTRVGPPHDPGHHGVGELAATTSTPTTSVPARAHARRARRRRPGPVPAAARRRAGARAGSSPPPVADVAMKGLRYLLEAWPSSAPSGPTSTSSSSASPRRRAVGRATIERARPRPTPSSSSTGVPDERIVELYAEAELAVVPSLYEGFSLPAIEAMRAACPLVATTGGALPEVVGADGETAAPRARPATPRRWPPRIACALDDPELRRQVGAAGRQRVIDRWSWRHTAERHRRAVPGTARRSPSRPTPRSDGDRCVRPGPLVLTVDYDRLGLRAGDCLLDLGCGVGRHAFEAFRRGARVVAVDFDRAELKEVPAAVRGHGRRRARRRPAAWRPPRCGDATRLPFPDGTFDRIIASEVHGAHPRRRGRRSPSWPGCCRPGGTHRRHRARRGCPRQVCWALSDEYHAPFVAAATCASTPSASCARSCAAPASSPAAPTTPTPCTRPYWWLQVRGRPHQRRPPAGAGLPPAPGVGHRRSARSSPGSPSGCSTRCSARASSSTPRKPRGRHVRTRRSPHGRSCHVADPRAARGPRRPHRAPRWRPPSTPSPSGSCPTGMIPWFPGGHADPWNHVEAAMALALGGRRAEAERAYEWLVDTPAARRRLAPVLPGRRGRAGQARRQRHAPTSPPACGTTGCSPATAGFLEAMWPVVERAIDFVLDLQTPRGEILWARHADGTPWSFALLTGSSCICHSLRCAIALAEQLGHERPDWELSAGPPGPRHPPRARRLRAEAPLGDGLVLPGARRRARRRRRPRAPRRRGCDDLRHGGPGRALRDATGPGSPRPRRASACWPTSRSASASSALDAVRAGRSTCATTTAATGPASCTPSEVHFPGGEQLDLHRGRGGAGRRRARAAPARPPACSSTTTPPPVARSTDAESTSPSLD